LIEYSGAVYWLNLSSKWIWENGIDDMPVRHSTIKRRRIRTVIDNLILIAGHLTDHARKLRLALGHSNGWICTFLRVAKSV
jgi:hypothetical protein